MNLGTLDLPKDKWKALANRIEQFVHGQDIRFFEESPEIESYDGSYFTRTDRSDLSMEQIWQTYVMLTCVEDAFRSLKNKLGLRPIHHSRRDRIEGHLFVSVLAYPLLQYILHHLRDAGLSHRWKTILSWLQMHELISTSMLKEDGRMIHLRYCTIPTLRQKEIYAALGITSVPLKPKKTTSQHYVVTINFPEQP